MTIVKTLAATFWTTSAAVVVVSTAAIILAVQVFGLRISGGIGLYFVVWWTALFAVLPFGARSQAETGQVVAGSEPGAPAMPAMREKALWTTVVAFLVFLLICGLLPLSGL